MVTKQSEVICLMGPTASGKTALAMELVQCFPCEIISVDSAMIYRGMDIGTAKPTPEELRLAPHRLIDICDPAQAYSVAQFRHDAIQEINDVLAQQRIPLLVGGTMMYYKALIDGLSVLPEADPVIREQIAYEAELKGWDVLHQELNDVDPISAARIHPNDPQRLSRALEVFRLSGRTMTELMEIKSEDLPYKFKQFAMIPQERSVLHRLIEQRFHQMLEKGFVAEVEKLMQRPDLHLDLPSMRCVGYRQCWEYLKDDYDYNEMILKSLAATRQLAKRQHTWLKSWKNVTWIESGDTKNADIMLNGDI